MRLKCFCVNIGFMVAMQSLDNRNSLPVEEGVDEGRPETLDRCSNLLEEENFTVSRAPVSPWEDGIRPPDLVATKGSEVVSVLVLEEDDVDAPETEARVRAAKQRGETRLYVPWPLRWRALSNLQRWGLPGVAVVGI